MEDPAMFRRVLMLVLAACSCGSDSPVDVAGT
jgi:hypothetical protein